MKVDTDSVASAEVAATGGEAPAAWPRVLRLTPHFYYPPVSPGGWPVRFDPVGGMQSQIYAQSLELARLGIEQVVLTTGMSGAPRVCSPVPRLTVRAVAWPMLPVRSELRGTVGLNQAWSAGVIAWAARSRLSRQRFDVVHAHGSGVIWPLIAALPVARLFGAALIFTVHCSVQFTYHPMSRADASLFPLWRRVESRALRRATKVITLTPRLRAAYAETGLRPEMLMTCPDCIDRDGFAAAATAERRAAFRQKFRLPPGRRVVLYLGRVAIEKGWPAFVTMAESLVDRDLHFLVVGDGNQRARLERTVDARGLRDRFTITGFVPREVVPAALAEADVLVLPSVHEEFGSALLEAMAMRVPIVAYAAGGIPQVIADGTNGMLVAPGDVVGLATAVRRVLDEPGWAEALTETGWDIVGRRYSLPRNMTALARLYRDCVALRRQ